MYRPVGILWIVAIMLVIFFGNAIAEEHHLYFFYWWLDMPMHLLGGLASALSVLWVLARFMGVKAPRQSRKYFFSMAVLTALAVGVVWEISELLLNKTLINVPLPIYLRDTLKDLLLDMSGGVLGSLFVLIMRYNKSHV